MIGVDFVSICSVFYMYFCNLNARFTPIFLNIILIPHLLIFAGIESKVSKEEGKKSKKTEPTQKHCFVEVKWFAKAKHPFTEAKEALIRRLVSGSLR